MLIWKIKCLGMVVVPPPLLGRGGREVRLGRVRPYLNSNACLLALRAGNQAAMNAMAMAVAATKI